MQAFILQEDFNTNVATAARLSALSGQTTREIAEDLLLNIYSDKELVNDVVLAADNALKFFSAECSSEGTPIALIPSALRQMQFCSQNYNCDGTKKPRKFLKGLLFNRNKSPVTNKVEQCRRDFLCYHLLTRTGVIPVAPQNWSL